MITNNAAKSYNITGMIDPPKKTESNWAAIFGGGVAGLLGILVLGFWSAFVVWKLWTWFVVPLGAPTLNVWHLWGLMMIFRVMVHESGLARQKRSSGDSPFIEAGGTAIGWALVLLTGWILSGLI